MKQSSHKQQQHQQQQKTPHQMSNQGDNHNKQNHHRKDAGKRKTSQEPTNHLESKPPEEIDDELKQEQEQQQQHLGSFLLIDENEMMQIESVDEFAEKLGCEPSSLIKVVSIFGSIGHGKSYTLNHAFYECQEVFQTSSSQESCTVGIWAAYDEKRRVITLDTEGLLGISANCQRRTRLLLKVLAISDIVIYRTKSERLEDNLFTFLGDASRVYVQHFFKELRNAFQRLPDLSGQACSELGPVVIIFQETRDTEPLKPEGANQTREHIIRSRFKTLGLSTEAFSAIEYVGIQTPIRPTNFDQLKSCIKRHIKNSFSRTPRPLSVIYTALNVLNEKFNGNIERTVPSMFPNQYLTCPTTCLSCNARCTNSMNHHRDGLGHKTDSKCIYQHQFNNHTLYCKACYERGDDVEVTPKTCSSTESAWVGLAKYAWAGYVIECSRCGIIHRSRQYWFGNKETWESCIRTEIKHVWQDELNKIQASQNAAQRVLDSVSYITETVTTIGAKPTKMVSEWVADQIAPNYWIPNSMLLQCALCSNQFGVFDQKHHCRLCGNGLCSTCSSKFKPVPERGWGETSVRVCDRCYERSDHLSAISSLPPLPPMLMLQAANNNIATNGCYNNSHNAALYEKDQDNNNQQNNEDDDNDNDDDDDDVEDDDRDNLNNHDEVENNDQDDGHIRDGDDDLDNHQHRGSNNNTNNKKANNSKNNNAKQSSKQKQANATTTTTTTTTNSNNKSSKASKKQQKKSNSIPIPQGGSRQGQGGSDGDACNSGSASRNTTPLTPQSSSIGSTSSSSCNTASNNPNNNNNQRRASVQNGYNNGPSGESQKLLSATESLESINSNKHLATSSIASANNHSNSISVHTVCTASSSSTSNAQLLTMNGTNDLLGGSAGSPNNAQTAAVTARKFGEVLQSTFKTVVSTAIDYPLGVIKDTARPDYWLPDSQINNCGLCKTNFNELVTIHHCRRCGGGFCHDCSTKTMLVPEKGWGDASVRVCDKCFDSKRS